MPEEATLLAAFAVGLLGSGHCLGMCGGIVGALTVGVRPHPRPSMLGLAPYLLLYNLGRIASYAVAGALAGGLSAVVLDTLGAQPARLLALTISGTFMIALGLYLAGWWQGLGALERLGARLWRRIEPFGSRFLPVRRPLQALGVGLVWGWLPCGMVYAALAWALASGSATRGALLMTAFGLGTLPMLLALGAAAEGLGRMVRRPLVRAAAGTLVLAFGLYTVALALLPEGPFALLQLPAAHRH